MLPPHLMPPHLVQMLLNLMPSPFLTGAWPSWSAPSSGWNLGWQTPPPNPFASLLNQWQSQQSPNVSAEFIEIAQALAEEALARSQQTLEGMAAFSRESAPRSESSHSVLWQRGSARLLDYAPDATESVAIFCVPSLINKYYILDLMPEHSMVNMLKAQGFRPLVLDWGTPGEAELGFSCADYITAYALDALHALRESHEGPITLLGYCMGGIFTVAMAQLAAFDCDGLMLLSTPWDFSAKDTPVVLLNPAAHTLLSAWFEGFSPVPPWLIQGIFTLIHPWAAQEKFRKFADLPENERAQFIALEQWVNDGVPLVKNVASEVFVAWPQQNILANHQWKVGRSWIEPSRIRCPSFVALPAHDKIVPTGVAMPLARMLPKATIHTPEAGHVSMVAGKHAPNQLWKPLSKWLKQHF